MVPNFSIWALLACALVFSGVLNAAECKVDSSEIANLAYAENYHPEVKSSDEKMITCSTVSSRGLRFSAYLKAAPLAESDGEASGEAKCFISLFGNEPLKAGWKYQEVDLGHSGKRPNGLKTEPKKPGVLVTIPLKKGKVESIGIYVKTVTLKNKNGDCGSWQTAFTGPALNQAPEEAVDTPLEVDTPGLGISLEAPSAAADEGE